jgi:hypothetical protein
MASTIARADREQTVEVAVISARPPARRSPAKRQRF